MADEKLDVIIRLVDEASKNLRNIKKEIGALGDETDTTSKKANDFSLVTKAGFAILASEISGAVKGIIQNTLSLAATYEQTQVAFTTMLGSAQEANTLLTDLSKFAAETPFNFQDLTTQAKFLTAFGFSVEELIPTLGALGDVSAGLSVPIGQIANAYGQVRVAGKLMGTELLQFTQAGVPLLDELAKMYDTNTSSIRDMVSEGKIGFSDVEKAFQNMTSEGGTFFNLMEEQSHTVSGLLSNIQDGFEQIATVIGGPVLESLKPALEWLSLKLQEIVSVIQNEGLQGAFDKWRNWILIIGGAIAGVLVGALVAATVALWAFISPVLAAVAIGAAVGAMIGLLVMWIIDLINTLKQIPAAVAVFEFFRDLVVSVFNTIWDVAQFIWDMIVGYMKMQFDVLKFLFTGAFNLFKWIVTDGWNAIKNFFSASLKWIEDKVSAFIAPFAEIGRALWGGFKNAAVTALESLKSIVKDVLNWIIQKINSVISGLNKVTGLGSAIGIDIPSISTIPMLAKGGNILQGGAAIVGENGPELLDLPTGARVSPLGKTGTTIVNNFYDTQVLSNDDVIEKLGDPLIRAVKNHMALVG